MNSADPITLFEFPSAIIHIDGDAFFASVEQAVHPELKGRPLVTGKERGIIACASYEAKAMGVKRGVQLHEAQKLCPNLVILPSDYETYSLYSKRMFDIMRRFTPAVEENSIDEAFLDITGMRRVHRKTYEEIAAQIQREIHAELDITVSVGLSLSKILAKLASKFRKPNGFTAVEGRYIHLFLQKTQLDAVCGFGPNTVELLTKLGLKTAYDFISRPEKWAEDLMGKVGKELWNELRGKSQYPVSAAEKSTYYSISKRKNLPRHRLTGITSMPNWSGILNPPSSKMRRHKLRARVLAVALRDRGFLQTGLEVVLNRSTSSTH